jgi:manganese/zinc/iron transport system permease protein
MNNMAISIILIACLTAVTCVLPGIFLVLRGVALMSDAISHAILPGIVIMFLCVGNLQSPVLMLGAALAGLCTVLCTEALIHTQRLKKDAAIGLVFPLFFSIGVILISRYARMVHLDVDMVMLGELAFAPLHHLIWLGIDWGPTAVITTTVILLINIFFTVLFFKELQLSIFDQTQAYLFGFRPRLLYYGLMMITSITAVGVFDLVGSIVVVALMITPPAAAYLMSNNLARLIEQSLLLSILTAVLGYMIAHRLDVSLAGSLAATSGLIFVIVLLCAPERGLIIRFFNDRVRAKELAQDIICTYCIEHHYVMIETIAYACGWSTSWTQRVINMIVKRGLIVIDHDRVMLTSMGNNYARQVYASVLARSYYR